MTGATPVKATLGPGRVVRDGAKAALLERSRPSAGSGLRPGASTPFIARFLRVLWYGAFAACLVTGADAANAGDRVASWALPLDRADEDRILALNPERVSEREVKEVLSRVPAPRILSFQGALIGLSTTSFAKFLIAMGYPEERLRNPRDGTYTYSSYVDSAQVAGALAWHYEREGMMPMLVGHSRGGLIAIRVLYGHGSAPMRPARAPRWRRVAAARIRAGSSLATGRGWITPPALC